MSVLKSWAAGRVFGGTWGTGATAVLALHGWRRDHLDFAELFTAPGAEPLTGMAPDLFGFGSTPPPPEPWGSAEYARQLLPLLDEPSLRAERIVVVGHSFGGRVALQLAGLVPDRVGRLVLTGVPLLARAGRRARPPVPYRAVRLAHRVGLVGETRLEAARQRYGSPDYRAAQGVMRSVLVRVLAEHYADLLPTIGCPVDLVWGEDDPEVPVEVAVRARPLFPAATLRSLPGVGHLTPIEAPEALRDAISGRSTSARSAPTGSGLPERVAADPARRPS